MSETRRWARLCAVLLGIAALLVGAPTASAHTDFDSSTPAQGDVVAEPVSVVTVVFTADTQPVDDLLVALDAGGNLQEPTDLTTDDQRTFTVTFDPPLAGGDIGIRWTVLGADGHPLEGTFSFDVTAPLPTTSTAPPATTSPISTEPTAVDTITNDGSPAEAAATAPPAAAPDESPVDSAPTETVPVEASVEDEQPPTQSLDEFLAVDTDVAGSGRLLAGRLLSIPAVAAAVGALAFLAWTLRGPAREIVALVSGVRIAGAVIALGALTQYSGAVATAGGSFATGWTEAPGRAMVVRLVGAVALVVGVRAVTVNRSASLAPRSKSLSAAVVVDPVSPAADASLRHRSSTHERWDVASSKPALAGVALLIASFWFDGHTVTKGWRPLHAVVNSVHVVAGSIWFGGVITLAALAWWRHRRGDDTRIVDLVVRFSSIATVALAAVAVAGLVLAVFVLDGFGELTGTEWGRMLILKTAGVALAASLGAYNHFRLRPAIVASPDDVAVRSTLRSVLTAEAILLSFVVIVTCWLVAAAT